MYTCTVFYTLCVSFQGSRIQNKKMLTYDNQGKSSLTNKVHGRDTPLGVILVHLGYNHAMVCVNNILSDVRPITNFFCKS